VSESVTCSEGHVQARVQTQRRLPLPENRKERLRRKGEPYFRLMEVTGSSEGTATKAKFSLLKYFMQMEIPNMWMRWLLESITRREAGPHTDKRLLDGINSAFDERGWLLHFQPSNSLLLNVKDYCIFPAMSKAVTAKQGLKIGCLLVDNEELWSYVEEVFEDLPPQTIARAYSSHRFRSG
jgi:hypothetical protein